MKSTVSIVIASLLLVSNASAQDGNAKKFLEDLSGNFKGRGQALIGPTDKSERVSCRLSNKLNSNSELLSIDGNCATTQGKMSVDGTLRVKGGNIEGSFLSASPNSKITKSSSSFSNNTLTLSMSTVNSATGNLNRTRQVVTRSGGGFASVFYQYDNGSKSFKKTGSVNFTKSGG